MAQKLDYYNRTHTGLSYSRQLVLHACPRKYELDAKKAIKGKIESATFSYGHAVAQGIQSIIAGATVNRSIIDAWLAYTHTGSLTESEEHGKKSIHWAMLAVEEFAKKYKAKVYSFLDGWEVARFQMTDPATGEDVLIPAVELTFVIELIDGFTYEGHIDLVLYHPVKQRYMVLELKSTASTRVAEASYKNSNQALGYGVVIDAIANNIKASASYDVFYMVYKSRTFEIVPFVFQKTPADRVRWLNGLLLDMQIVGMYEEQGYPLHGESCFDYFHDCEYLGICTMSDTAIDRAYTNTGDDGEVYSELTTPTFFFTIEQLLERQERLMELIAVGKENTSGDVDMLLDVVQIKR